MNGGTEWPVVVQSFGELEASNIMCLTTEHTFYSKFKNQINGVSYIR